MRPWRIRLATPDEAAAIVAVQTQTWLATYPNPELGITRSGLRRFLEGEHGERIAERTARIRQRIVAHAADAAGVVTSPQCLVRGSSGSPRRSSNRAGAGGSGRCTSCRPPRDRASTPR